ncbi:MAG: YgjV family protein [Bifidobacteriaceae bacterium]|nr:YgjV family protein [Bifidobacteriaceae bacterium]
MRISDCRCRDIEEGLNVFTATWWVAQALLVVVSLLGIIGVQQKRKRTILVFYISNTLLASVAVAMLDSYSASVVLAILTVLAVVSYAFDARGKKAPVWLIAAFIAVTVVAGVAVAHQVADVISIAASVTYIFAVFQKKERNLRWLTLLYLCLWVSFDLLVFAAAAIVTDTAQVVSTVIALVRLRDRKSERAAHG